MYICSPQNSHGNIVFGHPNLSVCGVSSFLSELQMKIMLSWSEIYPEAYEGAIQVVENSHHQVMMPEILQLIVGISVYFLHY